MVWGELVARILCVEDSSEFFIFLSSVLKDHSVSRAVDIRQAYQLTRGGKHNFDLILLDISLPDGSGLRALPQLRQGEIPIIVLSSDSDVLTKVAAFGVGADDYLSKPPDPNELRARIEARLRSVKTNEKSRTQLQVGNLFLDSDAMQAEIHLEDSRLEALNLTPSEFKILRMMISRLGQVYSRDQVIGQVWGVGKHVTPRTIDAHISNLRKKLANSTVEIETVTGSGYRGRLKDSGPGWDSSH
jgi:DNA-binding response OmpR family regulator